MNTAANKNDGLDQCIQDLRTGPEATALAFQLADMVAISDIECFCAGAGRREGGGRWYDTTLVRDIDREDVDRARLYLGLRGLLLCHDTKPHIVSFIETPV